MDRSQQRARTGDQGEHLRSVMIEQHAGGCRIRRVGGNHLEVGVGGSQPVQVRACGRDGDTSPPSAPKASAIPRPSPTLAPTIITLRDQFAISISPSWTPVQ
jgi:hypothetical protein